MITAITYHIIGFSTDVDIFQVKGWLSRVIAIYSSMVIDICLAKIALTIAF